MINIGNGVETGLLHSLVNKLHLNNNVYFLGKIPNKDVISLMKLCECFVITSQNVVFDLVILEALACGMTVFASDDGGNREIIKNGINGYLLSNNNPFDVANMLLKCDPLKVKNNAILTAQNYSNKFMVEEYEKLYIKLINDKFNID
jgi:glycosyltransferase involved in cell wall biosynthesis